MKLWDIRDLFPDPFDGFRLIHPDDNPVDFGSFIPDAEGFPYIFSDYHLNEAIHHLKYIDKYGLDWWIDVMEKAKAQPIN